MKDFSDLRPEDIVDVEEAAKILRMRVRGVYELTRMRRIKFYRAPGGKKIYFAKSDLVAFMTATIFESRTGLAAEAQEALSRTR